MKKTEFQFICCMLLVLGLAALYFMKFSPKKDNQAANKNDNQIPNTVQNRKIIDVHFHTYEWNDFGDPPPQNDVTGNVPKAKSNDEVKSVMLGTLKKNNIVKAITSGNQKLIDEYKLEQNSLIEEGLLIMNEDELPELESFEKMIQDGKLKVFGELGLQYFGKTLADPLFEPYLKICEQYKIPVALHTGISFPGTPYHGFPDFRVSLGNPQLIEDVLVKHPDLKVQLMHMGYPYLEQTKSILFVYPQVYVDVATIDWLLPKTDFYNYLKALIDGGFEKRIMYGSDQMVWDDAIELSIKNIESAPFLDSIQKQDIFYNNAATFFNLNQSTQ